jgi:hypothetical protein
LGLRSRESIKPWWRSAVIATRIGHSLEEFAAAAFAEVKLDCDNVDIDQSPMRPSDIACSLGTPARPRVCEIGALIVSAE